MTNILSFTFKYLSDHKNAQLSSHSNDCFNNKNPQGQKCIFRCILSNLSSVVQQPIQLCKGGVDIRLDLS